MLIPTLLHNPTPQAKWRQQSQARKAAERLRAEWAAQWDAAVAAAAADGADDVGALREALSRGDDGGRCLAALLRFFDPRRADDVRRLAAVCAALTRDGCRGATGRLGRWGASGLAFVAWCGGLCRAHSNSAHSSTTSKP